MSAPARRRRFDRLRGRGRAVLAGLVTMFVVSTVTGSAGSASALGLCDLGGATAKSLCDLAGKGIGAAASTAVGGTFEKIVNSLLDGYQTVLTWALGWWIKLPSPDLSNKTGLMQQVHDHTLQIQLIGLTFSLMFFGLRMLVDRKRSIAEDAEDGFKLAIRALLATAAIPLMLTTGGQISDGISNWLIGDAINAGGNNGDIIKNFLKINLLTGGGLGTAALGIFALVGFLGAIMQLILLVVREAMLLLVVAALPIAASFSGTGPGSQSYQRLITWSVAFLLFKPVGALTYFIAFKAAGQKTNDQQVVLGMVLMMMCAFVLPALMRLIAPATSSMGSGGSGAAAAGAALGAVATVGALAATGGASAAAGGGGAASTSAISSRGGGAPPGGISSASGPPPSPPPPSPPSATRPGAQPALSGGEGGSQSSSGSSGSGGQGGPTRGMSESMGQAGSMAANALSGAEESIGREADVSGPELTAQPEMQSGWGEHAMSS